MCESLSRVPLLVTPWTVARQAPPSMRFSRQEYWSGLPCPPPGDIPNPGIELRSPALQADSLPIDLLAKSSPPPASVNKVDWHRAMLIHFCALNLLHVMARLSCDRDIITTKPRTVIICPLTEGLPRSVLLLAQCLCIVVIVSLLNL